MKKLFLLLLIVISAQAVFLSCGNKKDKKTGEVSKADTVVKDSPVAEKGVKLICKDLMVPDTVGNPLFDVFLSVDGVKTKIKSINQCSEIPKEEYARYEIPKEAIAACGGWYAGGGDYYYVIMRDGKPVVFEGFQEEQQEDNGYHWKEIVVK
jgi:hypothetical protein